MFIYFAVRHAAGGNSAVTLKWKKDFLPEVCTSSVEVYDPATKMWSQGPELANALCGAGEYRTISALRFHLHVTSNRLLDSVTDLTSALLLPVSISHRPLVSVSVCLVLPSPSFASCTWSPNLLAFSRNLYQVFVGQCLPLGLAVCTVVPAWLCCCHFTMCVQGEHQSLVSYFLCLQIFVHCLTTCVW